jgi:hypothetical protein
MLTYVAAAQAALDAGIKRESAEPVISKPEAHAHMYLKGSDVYLNSAARQAHPVTAAYVSIRQHTLTYAGDAGDANECAPEEGEVRVQLHAHTHTHTHTIYIYIYTHTHHYEVLRHSAMRP